MNSPAPSFEFGSKGETLARLRAEGLPVRFCEQRVFAVAAWRADPDAVLGDLRDSFAGCRLAVRSCARAEDRADGSNAGAFHSELNVAAEAGAIRRAIARVIDSYGAGQADDQVLVQPMVEHVEIAGVVLTRHLDTGAPYYVINYDDRGGRTDAVTGGGISKCLLVHRAHWQALRSPRFRALIVDTRSIEARVGSERLDIEFCIDRAERIFILQVRPLAAGRRWPDLDEAALDATLNRLAGELAALLGPDPGWLGARTCFGEMPDWNPAEMIGAAPRPLALSLYRRLITDRAWAVARRAMGYRAVPAGPLLHAFAGRPMIDVRRSLNSFLPAGLPDAIGEALVSWQVARLVARPHLHDRIEFEIAMTCWEPGLDARLQALRDDGLALGDLAVRLAALSDTAVAGLDADGLIARVDAMAATHPLPSMPDDTAPLARALDACERDGIVPFAQLARHAFIAVAILSGLVARGALAPARRDALMRAIETVAGDLVHDHAALGRGALSRADFLTRYGHLRPGSYDILSPRYDEAPELYLAGARPPILPSVPSEPFAWTQAEARAIDAILDEAALSFDAGGLLAYARAAIAGRERAKFGFTRLLSDALVWIERWADARQLSAEQASLLPIQRILDNPPNAALREEIAAAEAAYALSRAMQMPHLIDTGDAVHVVRRPLGRPTFVGDRRITARAVRIAGPEAPDLAGAIVLIESADPGFDWIFARAIAGLVTQYGGANSHMAIRCAEFGLPAAIGCGTRLFESLSGAGMIELDAAGHSVRPLAGGRG